jgi:beta-1,4-mannosyltransferase
MSAIAAFPATVRGNPYCDLLYGRLAAGGVRVARDARFSVRWLVRNRRRVQVLHMHWPEMYYRTHGRATLRSVSAFTAALLVARLLGYRMVWTIHNALPHEASVVDRAMRWLLLRIAQPVVHAATARTVLPRAARQATIVPHGHYIGAYPHRIPDEAARRRLGLTPTQTVFLCFGQLRPYKGVPELLESFRALPGDHLRLVVAGQPVGNAVRHAVVAAALHDRRIVAHTERIADEDVQLYFGAADWVVLPYRDVLTSGTAMLALSFGRPLIVPRRGCLGEFAEVGCAIAYDPDEPGALGAALARALGSDARALRRCALETARANDWDTIARAYARIFAGA